jgi:hypothetical protein
MEELEAGRLPYRKEDDFAAWAADGRESRKPIPRQVKPHKFHGDLNYTFHLWDSAVISDIVIL